MQPEIDTRILFWLRRFTTASSLGVVGLSLIVISGWLLNIPILKSFSAGLPAMRFNTALSLLLLGSSLWLLKDEEPGPPGKRLGQLLASMVLLLNLLTLGQYLFGWNLGIDEFLVKDLDSPAELFPGRIAPIVILCASLSSVSLLRLGSKISRYFSYGVTALSFLIILNNVFDFQLLLRQSVSNLVPAPTGVAFIMISLAVLTARPAHELVDIFSSNLPGSRAMRLLLLGIVLLTIVMAWLVEQGVRRGILDAGKDTLFFAILIIFAYAPLIYFIARNIDEAGAKLLLSDQILERVNALVLVADAHGAITYVSPAVKTILGYEPAELLGDGWWKVSRSTLAQGEPEIGRIRSSAGKTIGHAPYEREIPDRWGKTHWIMWVDAQGPGSSVIAVGHDITERKHTERALQQSEQEFRALSALLEQRVVERTADLNRSKAELERASHAKDEFLATMSHELRTPLNSVLGMSEILLEERRGSLNEYQQKALHLIESSGRHLLALINDILDLSKIEAGKLELHPEIVEILDVCESSLAFVREQAVKKSIVVEFRHSQAAAALEADPRYLKQILVNLLSNAVKFTPANGQVALEVTADAEQGYVQFSVSDTGIGISPENLAKLFRPFVQVDSSLSRQYEGTGLGLALVQRLADLHGGSVQVESQVDQGSCFRVNLPWQPGVNSYPAITEQLTSDSDSGSIAGTDGLPTSPAQRGPILLVEDNPANVLTVSEYLESRNFQVVVAHNGLEAIARAFEANPALILMDIQMPLMDGLEATRRLRADSRFRSVPIIALTALAMPGDAERCLQAGVTEYLSKPVSLKGLVKMIEALTAKAT